MKGLQSQPDFEISEVPDEDGMLWATWYLEKNTCDERQCELVSYNMRDVPLYDILIDEDAEDEVSDFALLQLVKVVS